MKTLIKLFLVALSVFLYCGSLSIAKSTETVPYPEGYRRWTHVKSVLIGKDNPTYKKHMGIHHIYANPKAMEGFEKGSFPDGSVIVYDLLEAPENNGITSEGPRRFIDVMHKDSKKFAKTSGWGFEEFNGSSQTERLLTEETATACSACHASQKDHVFSNFRR